MQFPALNIQLIKSRIKFRESGGTAACKLLEEQETDRFCSLLFYTFFFIAAILLSLN